MRSYTNLIKNIALLSVVTVLDITGKSNRIADNKFHIAKAFEWLKNAQDAAGECGGVSEGFHLVHGWLPPYPETTGYIIETFFEYFHLIGEKEFEDRALRMADWLLGIQNPDGSIPDSYFRKKMVFDTGQVIFGFVRSYEETGNQTYLNAALKAGNWLVEVQEQDGAWRKFAVNGIPHTYYSRVAWSLLKLHEVTEEEKFKVAAVKNINWVLSRQARTGWFDEASFSLANHKMPFTHTIAYTIRGILEAGMHLNEGRLIASAIEAADSLIKGVRSDGFVCGTYDRDWKGGENFCCLTGSAQLAIILFKLFSITKDRKYLLKARDINNFLKSKQQLSVKYKGVYGGIAGSFPIWGRYIHFTYPNWAAKFFIDSLLMENSVIQSE